MNYEDMSDLQLNLLVANSIGVDAAENSGVVYGSVKHCGDNVISVIGVVDYCNNPSDAWPILHENNIGVMPWNNIEWQAFLSLGGLEGIRFRTIDTNPFRAAMIVFLMIKEAERG